MNRIIAIDGTCASGKSALAKGLSRTLDLPYLNTGALYRNIALFLYKNRLDHDDKQVVLDNLKNVSFDDLENPELSGEVVGAITSQIAVIPELRQFLLKFQIDFSKNEKGAILDGRDIGTVICPNARYKFFVIADINVRAERRYNEMKNRGIAADYDEILEKIRIRDKNDFERAVAPLKKADDAIEIDTTKMNQKKALEYALEFIQAAP
ncbi:MAG: (d)CMP kinase [Rickettsiales bacterium]|jgi:cytidylate kinase|nr:(d)CMP kinase [Rickettsiales bacterium]